MFHGGRGSGKSFNITESLVLWADVIQDRFLLAREIMNSIADSCHAQMVEHIERLNLARRFIINKNTIRNRATGAEFIYRGLRSNVNSVKSLNGIGFCFVEEGQAVSNASWKILLPTIRKSRSRIIIACNPEDPDSFMQKRWIDNPCVNTASVQVNYCDNPYFPQELEDERQYALMLIRTAPNEDARIQAQADYDWVWEGQVKRITAAQVIRRAVIKEFETPYHAEFYYGMDFGFSNDPNALVRCFIQYDDAGIPDLYVDYEVVGRVETDELPQLMINGMPGVKNWPIYADAARPETISYLANRNFQISAAQKWQGSVEDGIAFLNQFRRIYVHPRCKTVIQEIRDYKYKVDKVSGEVLPILVDAHNHTWDALRYALWTQIKNRGGSWF
jgi:phage terminase large subunit